MTDEINTSSVLHDHQENEEKFHHSILYSQAMSKENLLEIHHVEDEHLKDAYNQLYIDRPIRHTDSFYHWILKILKPQKGQFFLDIACGQGRLVELAAANEVHAYGSDISFRAVHGNSADSHDLLVCDGQDLPFPESCFDYIANIGSLEHFVDPIVGAREMSRVLKTGGLACVLVPNTYGIFSTVLYAFHTGRLADDGQPIQRYATRYKWQDLLESNGLKVIRTLKYECEWPLTIRDWGVLLRQPKALVRLFLTPILPLNLANSFVYICRRK
jgi:SAM-dependent methyltransferase